MQARAIFEAAITMSNQGVKVFPEIMVPLVGTPQASSFISILHLLHLYTVDELVISMYPDDNMLAK